MPGAATKLGRVFAEWYEMYAGSSEATLTDRRLDSWRFIRKWEMRIAVRLLEDKSVGNLGECCEKQGDIAATYGGVKSVI